jgi:hypothetical protein
MVRRLTVYLLSPVAATIYAIAFWRFAADLNWSGEFFISKGLFSRWQVWAALGAAVQIAAHQVGRARGLTRR